MAFSAGLAASAVLRLGGAFAWASDALQARRPHTPALPPSPPPPPPTPHPTPPRQAIGLLDDLDKELNTYAMRVREWYGWHFPEMTKIVADNIAYAKTGAPRVIDWCFAWVEGVVLC